MGQTKAAKAIKALHDNELASSVLEAIIKNDDDLLQEALDDASLSSDDFTLSDDEFKNLLKGVQPSGELDFVTWEGYYEATSWPESTGPKAFLILAATEKVYFGSPSDIQDKPFKHGVKHTLTTDGKIEFTLAGGEKVSIALNRAWDEDSHSDATSFTGTIKGMDISGKQTTPPRKTKAEKISTTAKLASTIKKLKLGDTQLSLKADGNDRKWTWTDEFTAWQISTFWIPIFFTYLSGIFTLYEIFNRFRNRDNATKKKEGSDRVKKSVEGSQKLLEEVVEENCTVDPVDYTDAAPIVTEETISDLNESLRSNSPDYNVETVEVIVEDRRETAKEAGDAATKRFTRASITSSIIDQLSGVRFLDDYDGLEKGITDKRVDAQAQPKTDQLPSTSYDPLVRYVVLQNRAEYYGDSYLAAEEAAGGAKEAYEAAETNTAAIETQIQEINDKIETEKSSDQADQDQIEQDEERKEELERELEEAKTDEEDKQRKRDEADKEEADAKKKQNESKEEADASKDKEKWEDKAREVFK